MSTTFVVPDGLPYVGAAILSTVCLLIGQMQVVMYYRKKAGIEYPQAYADKADQERSPNAMKFNCAQRAHQNTLETIPIAWATTLLTAVRYPHFAAGALFTWFFGRLVYTQGYMSGVPSKRRGFFNSLGLFALVVQVFVGGYIIAGRPL